MQYDERSNDQEVFTKTSEEFEISLSETRTAGYHWVVTEKGEPVLELLAEMTIPNAGAVGGSGHRVWRFRAACQGETKLMFEYSRPWEKSAKPARTFALKVRVGS